MNYYFSTISSKCCLHIEENGGFDGRWAQLFEDSLFEVDQSSKSNISVCSSGNSGENNLSLIEMSAKADTPAKVEALKANTLNIYSIEAKSIKEPLLQKLLVGNDFQNEQNEDDIPEAEINYQKKHANLFKSIHGLCLKVLSTKEKSAKISGIGFENEMIDINNKVSQIFELDNQALPELKAEIELAYPLLGKQDLRICGDPGSDDYSSFVRLLYEALGL